VASGKVRQERSVKIGKRLKALNHKQSNRHLSGSLIGVNSAEGKLDKEIKIMTDNKYIPKLPETRTQIILNQGQTQPQTEQKSTTEKAVESIANVASAAKETVIPTVHASDDDPVEAFAKGVATELNTAAVGITTAVCPPAGAVLTGVESAAGTIMSDSKDRDTKEVGQILSVTSAIGSGVGGAASSAVNQGTGEAVKKVGEAATKGVAGQS